MLESKIGARSLRNRLDTDLCATIRFVGPAPALPPFGGTFRLRRTTSVLIVL